MNLRISTRLLTALRDEAAAAHEVEICGLLTGAGPETGIGMTIDAAIPARNVSTSPDRAFEIDPATLIAAHRAARAGGPAILGCYHSHPGGSCLPSQTDAAVAAPDGAVWLIVGREVGVWRAVAHGALFGRFDAAAWRPIA